MTVYSYSGVSSSINLSNIIEKNKKIFFYNPSSINLYSEDDYGLISDISSFDDDYGLVSQTAYRGELDYQNITGFGSSESIYPFGSLTISGTSEFNPKYIDIDIFGSAYTNFIRSSYVPIGTINILPLPAAEVKISYNPPENTELVNVSGSLTESITNTYYGSGSKSFVGICNESFTSSPEVITDNISISGRGNAVIIFSTYVGSGTVFISGSAEESFISNPPESAVLFSISGTLKETETESYKGLGTVFATGSSIEKETNSHRGSGSFNINGNVKEYFIANPPENIQNINISGVGKESFVANPPENIQNISVSGVSQESSTDSYVATGTIFLSGFAEESFISNPSEGTVLFNISGTITERQTDSYRGSGFTTISGTITERQTDSYRGSGTASVSGSAQQSFVANPTENTQLFVISGTSQKSYIVNPPEDTAFISITGQSVEKFVTNLPEGTLLFNIFGTAKERESNSYAGLGNISISGIGKESFIFNPPEGTQLFVISGIGKESFISNPPEGTQLFTISGRSLISITNSIVGIGSININGSSIDRLIKYQPPRTYVVII